MSIQLQCAGLCSPKWDGEQELLGSWDAKKKLTLKHLGTLKYPEPEEFDLLIVGDSSLALIEDSGGKSASGKNARTVGDYLALKKDIICGPYCKEVKTRMVWGKGLQAINDTIEYELRERRRERKTRQVLLLVSWAGNDVWGARGFVGNDWIDRSSSSRNLKIQDAAKDLQNERAQAVFSEITRLAEIASRKGMAGCSAFVPTLHTAYNLGYYYSVQMQSLTGMMERHGLWVFDGSHFLAATTRRDNYHMVDDENNRREAVKFYAAMASAGSMLARLLKHRPLLQIITGIRPYLKGYEPKEKERPPTEVWSEEQIEEAYRKEEEERARRRERRPKKKTAVEVYSEAKLAAAPAESDKDAMPIYVPS